MVKIGITGAAGFIGSNLCQVLSAQKKFQIVAIDNFLTSSYDNLRGVIPHKNISFHKLDVLDLGKLSKVFQNVDIIMHLASLKIPRYAKRLETLLINTKSTENILEIARKNHAKVIFGSTSDVYGKNPILPFRESSDLVLGHSEIARWAYATSKIFDEHLCFGYWEDYHVPFVILRFFNVYGPRQSRNWLGGPQSLFIDALLSGRQIEIHGNGHQTRSFSYVGDIIEGIIKSIDEPKAIGQILNLGATQEISIINFAKLISKLLAKPLKIKKIPYKSFTGKIYEDVARRRPDIKKARVVLGWQPKTPLVEGLKKTIAWHIQNPI